MRSYQINPSRLQLPCDCKGQQINPQGVPEGDMLDFVMAVDLFKKVNQRTFLRTSEIYELILFLGYRKVRPPLEKISQVEQARKEMATVGAGEYHRHRKVV